MGRIRLVTKNSSDHRIFVTVVEFRDTIPPVVYPRCRTAPDRKAAPYDTDLSGSVPYGADQRDGRPRGSRQHIVFTDLKGSTELYERIGDLNVLALVQQHFERLTLVTVRHNGAIIKTLGDAVMAAFMRPADTVKAALAMRSEIARFNAERTEPDLILKVGLHRGAAIAVTFNDRLDYFGQSVNIAARVEALADGGEICLTREVNDAPEMRAILASYPVFECTSPPEGRSRRDVGVACR